MGPRIVLAGGEPFLARMLMSPITARGFLASHVETASALLPAIRSGEIEIVLLDEGIADIGAVELVPFLHNEGIGVIVLVDQADEAKRVALLDAGADDVVERPFGIDELMARARAILRRGAASRQPKPPASFERDAFRLDFAAHRASIEDREIRLSPKEFALLAALCRKPGELVTWRQLLIAGWQDPAADRQALRVYMTLLRRKLVEAGVSRSLVENVPGVGYRVAAGPAAD